MDYRYIEELNILSEKGDKFNFNKYYQSIPQRDKNILGTVHYTISTLDMIYKIDPDIFKKKGYYNKTGLFDTIRMDYFCHLSNKMKKRKESSFLQISEKELSKMKKESYENLKSRIKYLISKGVDPNNRNNSGELFFNLKDLCFEVENENIFFVEYLEDFFRFLKEDLKVDLYVSDFESFINNIQLGSSSINKYLKPLLKYLEGYEPSVSFLKNFIGAKNHRGFLDNNKINNLDAEVNLDDFKITDNLSMISYLLKKYKIDLNKIDNTSGYIFLSDLIQFKETFNLLIKYGWNFQIEIDKKKKLNQDIDPFIYKCLTYNEKEVLLKNCNINDKNKVRKRI